MIKYTGKVWDGLLELPPDWYDKYIMTKGDIFIIDFGRGEHCLDPRKVGEEVSGYHGTPVKRLHDAPAWYSYWVPLPEGAVAQPRQKPKIFVPRSVYHPTPLPLP